VAGSDHAPILAGYQIPSRDPPIRPALERVDRRLNVHVRKNQSEEIANLQAATVTWYENSHIQNQDTPGSLEEKNTRLEVIQEGICSVAEKELLKPKKESIKRDILFWCISHTLQMLKTHLHCLVRLQMLLDHPLSCNSYKADGSLKGPRLRRYLKQLAVWRDNAKSIFDKMDHGDQLRNPIATRSGGTRLGMSTRSGMHSTRHLIFAGERSGNTNLSGAPASNQM
jgi:hypothetical protein